MPRIIPAPGGGGSTFGIDNAQAGLWVPAGAPQCSQIAFTLQANKLMLVRFVAPKTVSVSKYAFLVLTAATANDNCDAGVYNSDCSLLLGSAGSIAGKLNVTGIQTLNFLAPIALIAGQIYHAAFIQGPLGGTGASILGTSNPFYLNNPFGSTVPTYEQSYFSPGAIPLVSAPGAIQPVTNSAPIAALQT